MQIHKHLFINVLTLTYTKSSSISIFDFLGKIIAALCNLHPTF